MATIQERLQRKREPLDKWSIREQLCLASAVVRSGDQNWMSVSRALKPFGEPNRPPDWFHQKNCAAQYGALLENVETPKRKKRCSESVETPSEIILSKLKAERKAELKKLMEEETVDYQKLQEDMNLLKAGNVSEDQLDIWCKEIDEEEAQKEKEALAHAQWLKERELRKIEIEKAWRPTVKITTLPIAGVKRKASDSIDMLEEATESSPISTSTPEPSKPGLSPLLTSLLKSPSHSQNVVTSSILHSAITSQRPTNSNTSPTIASLLNSSASVQVSPGLQQLVSTAISQEPTPQVIKNPITDLLNVSADSLPNLKAEDIESTIYSTEPLPEIKNEEVDVIISDLIENADIENQLLDGNDDIITDFENELEELVNKEKAVAEAAAEAAKLEASKAELQAEVEKSMQNVSKEQLEVDPFEFQEDPVEYEPAKLINKPQTAISAPAQEINTPVKEEIVEDDVQDEVATKEEVVDEPVKEKEEAPANTVETIEDVVMEDQEANKESKEDAKEEPEEVEEEEEEEEEEDNGEDDESAIPEVAKVKEDEEEVVNTVDEKKEEIPAKEDAEEVKSDKEETPLESPSELIDIDLKQDQEEVKEAVDDDSTRRNTFTPEYSEDFDEMNIEVTKTDKPGKIKRDYSRTKKKEEPDFDILIPVEDDVKANIEEENESLSEKEDEKKVETVAVIKPKIKLENERSNSPWTEEEESSGVRTRRRYSTPATPVDSVPNSPASSNVYFEDDRDYRNWKKSIMLVYSRLTTHKYASLFHKPITNEQAPGYHNIVRRPMDLQTLRKNIESGTIRTTAEFQRDVLIMFNNAIMYNKTNDTVYKMAYEMQQEGVEQINILVQAQAQNDSTPARRETRTSEGPGTKRKRGVEEFSKNKKRKDD